ncbi:MAG: phosphoribosylformylglycinamidine synthase [Candidatus Doudnabacteria bacterium RIFCSPHIGHO2_01_FULL_50_67]|uniref:Phosphoribosylformylglycinamidine synthase subunit PurL n=1 Tax=Candidatus Doudnabacteria bacterium RIFCSPHIGHO2_12_FULL_48_16 TaxID=1817838 RepID=A0A1F5PKM1_9BACT|nr:MAG: phosphoribosylformylglycinamidine synthase [Candidatus Doudnabacteria bacterium RIFCSPHIGHO2_02_FULL_49_24]OGE89145.1 MAG: phosphoribosylformylglycinamidine synthase [Candidatus Doudnabacteria bacterium RIFCSPHIGHO2_01_FULL_50_67]OGE90409.1 MAG: phosphoribosylformylglycinamidine synthase [Candidatus Doudnabacteria bacterium RIFCSPHIGHO2_12_FULL_48_16]OGE97241.1 MAG: phosphoribosylformylglycinamidine synthase [Candidatus Doudnabacteria bacterium RIFCSPLOWO2_01_FULL_49_40]OGF03834.1 MAG: 
MATRLDIKFKVPDTRGWVKQANFENLGLKGKIKRVLVVDSYMVDAALTAAQTRQIGQSLANPLTEEITINASKPQGRFDWVIEIGFLPGVTDNVGATAAEAASDLLGKKFKASESIYSSQLFFITGKLTEDEVDKIAGSLHNPLIQRAQIKNYRQFVRDRGLGRVVPKVALRPGKLVRQVNLNVPDEELVKIGKQGIANPDGSRRGPLALSLPYMKAIQKQFAFLKRNPTDVELEALAQTWSEHCKHTIFANPLDEIKDGLYKTYIKRATEIIRQKKGDKDFCASVFTDNSGAIEFDQNYLITHKVETHNTPSALDPFGGAITGIVGVNRDTIGFGLGAKPVINTYGFCFADPRDRRPLYRDSNLTQKILPPKRIMEGVIRGINVGGNCSGVPTALGFMLFDDSYRGKPMVFAGTVGLIPKRARGLKLYEKQARPGDYIVMVGGRVGQDGIHGATFSSEGIDAGSPATAVQIGDPITQKKFSDALVKEARDLGLYRSITDNGAGGLSSSVPEMAKESGGCLVWLDKVPLKYPGLEPWKIWISESQERMTLAVPKNKWLKLKKLLQARGSEATVIGLFTDSGRCVVKHKRQTLIDLTMEFLHHGLPKLQLKSQAVKVVGSAGPLRPVKDYGPELLKMLGRLNLASTEFVSTQYDHEVQGTSVLKPLQGPGRVSGDCAVSKPLLTSNRGVVLSYGINPSYAELDSYRMAGAAIDTAIRNAVAAGADPEMLALLDNFCWCSSTDPKRLFQLKEAVRSCFDHVLLYETPFISGKDSMFNDFSGFDQKGRPVTISILPTLLITSIGVIPDVTKVVSLDAKTPKDLVYLLGRTDDELGGSEYMAMVSEELGEKFTGQNVPQVDCLRNRKLYSDFYKCVQKDLIASSISVGRGGLALALAKTALGGKLGSKVDLAALPGQAASSQQRLFSESQGRLLVTINPKNQSEFEALMAGNSSALMGQVTDTDSIQIQNGRQTVAKLSLAEAHKAYKSAFKGY